MSDRTNAGLGLVAFFAVVALPFWLSLTSEAGASAPALELPANATECVENIDFMSTNHMELLNDWRTAVVRNGERHYMSSGGTTYDISLTGTCLGCHENPDTFCNACHEYTDVDPKCWNCHLQPGAN